MYIKIGAPNWVNELRQATTSLGDGFWSRFVPVSNVELQKLEGQVDRKLPDDFKEFYKSIGCGSFEPGVCFYSPDDIVSSIGAPIYYVLGSLFPGQEWATADQHRQLWLSRGANNPALEKFTDEALTLGGVKLYDLLQFGIDGSCCYYQLYVGPDPAPFRYCLLTDSGTIEEETFSFSDVLEGILVSRMSTRSE